MALRHRKPTSPGRRFQSVSDFAELTTSTPEKSLLSPKPKSGGRNNYGRKTSRHRGGGHKQQYRVIDFKRNKDHIPAKVATSAVSYTHLDVYKRQEGRRRARSGAVQARDHHAPHERCV